MVYDLCFRKPRLTVLVLGLILVAGLTALNSLPRQEDPALTERYGSVTVTLPGASAERVEALITEKLENALQEVESALVDIDAIQKSRNEQLLAAESSNAAYDQLDALYREGLASFIDVLDAQRTLIASRESLVQTEANLATAMIALYSALDIGCHDAALPGCGAVETEGFEPVVETAETLPGSTNDTVLPG